MREAVAPAGAQRLLSGVGLAAVAVVLCVVTALVVEAGATSSHPWSEGIARALMVGAPLAVGLYARHRPPFVRFGTLLALVGVAAFVATLAGSANEIVASLGRIAGWWVEVGFAYLILAFPTGRLTARIDKSLFWFAVGLVTVLYLPTVLLVDHYPVPTPWAGCNATCPGNAFMVTGHEPGVVDGLIRPVREALTILLFGAVTVRVGFRLAGASRLLRRTLAPVLVVAGFRFVVQALALVVRQVDSSSELAVVGVWLTAAALPALALAFLLGVARWRLFLAGAMQDLATRLPVHAEPEQLQVALGEAFDDPSIQLVHRLDNGREVHWVDAMGMPYMPPPIESGRWLTEVLDEGLPVGAIVHDAALREDEAFVATATSYALMTLDNQRLLAQTGALLREVRDSRARIQATADDERRKIERDLHDGAQQRLVALRIKLELAAEESGKEHPRHAVMLRRLGVDVEEALDEVRSLARGIYPSALADRGLVEALRSAALQSPLPGTVLAAGVGRYSREIETAAYFCCLEALQNAAKHAEGATVAVIDLCDDGTLRLEVRDDGAGFDPATSQPGAGFVNMRDRLSAVGGELATVSSPGKGTRVVVKIPLHRP